MIHPFDEYAQVRATAAGRYLIENPSVQNGGTIYMPSETCDTLGEALSRLETARDQYRAAAEQARAVHVSDLRFTDSRPDLVRRQLAWQKWRCETYDRRVRAARLTSREALMHGSDRNAGKTARFAMEAAEELDNYQGSICDADSATKRAIREHDADAWEASLDHCEQLSHNGQAH